MNHGQRIRVTCLSAAMGFLAEHPRLVRCLLRPVANAPWLSSRLPVLLRGFLGATAFEIHDVDLKRGRIGIGGVEEIMFGAKIAHLLHTVPAETLGESETNRLLYQLGLRLCRWEVTQALEGGRWAPAELAPLIFHRRILEEVRSDPAMARFFTRVMDMMSRLITDEGGWGHLEFDVVSEPLRVSLSHSQEAAWLGPSETPVCHLYAGIVAGYTSTLTGLEMQAREVACAATGAPKCVFEVVPA